MGVINWQPGYATGIAAIDGEHQELVRLINRLYESVREENGASELPGIVAELVRYTESHFANEEGLMEQHDFPGLEQHANLHRKLEQAVRRVQERLDGGEKGLGMELFQFMRHWLLDHILEKDRNLGEHLQNAS